MDRQQISVKLTIDGLKLPFKIDSFEDRLILQKAVYLAQTAGINLGYYYQWYLYGPYSPSLTQDEYAIDMDISTGLDESRKWKLDDASRRRLGEIQAIFTEPQRNKLRRKLELLASVHFLIDRKQVPGANTKQITETLKRFNKDFSEEEVNGALGGLKTYGLLQR